MLLTTVKKVNKVFGKLTLVGVSENSLDGLYPDNVLQPNHLYFKDRFDKDITLSLHDLSVEILEPEFDDEEPRIIKVDLVVSIDVSEETEENAMIEAFTAFSEHNTDICDFALITYSGDTYNFGTIHFENEWKEYLASDEH